ncbi:MAG: HD domain-containing protein [Candidatus Saccharimonadales bacterium]
MLTLDDVKKHPQIAEFIRQTEEAMVAIGYTNHGLRHSNVVAGRGMDIAREVGLSVREQELAGIACYCHDMGNFMTRHLHHHFGAILFSQVFMGELEPRELTWIVQAIANHDKEDMNFTNRISAVLVLADKSDVERSRVTQKSLEKVRMDIHNRVNYATEASSIRVERGKKRITLTLKIDTNFCPIMEYFEIFAERMEFCRTAAHFLGYDFGLIINSFRLL